jgi:hypothetical protein
LTGGVELLLLLPIGIAVLELTDRLDETGGAQAFPWVRMNALTPAFADFAPSVTFR